MGAMDGLDAFAEKEVCVESGPVADLFEDLVLFLPLDEVGGRDRVLLDAASGVAFPESDDAVGFGEGKGFEEDGVDDAEDGGVGADAEGEGEDGDCGEGGVFPELAERVFQVGPHKSLCR